MAKSIQSLGKKELLSLARSRIFTLGLKDLASELSMKNMEYGLAKILYALDSDRAFSFFSPDATITRNIGRWMSGFGYGMVIRWPGNVFFPEIRPNGCGMILVKLNGKPSRKEIIKTAGELNYSDLSLDGYSIEPDFGKGNHFFEFYSVLNSQEEKIPEDCYYAIIHGSSPERKSDMYGVIDSAPRVKTPLGDIAMLEGKEANEYYRKWIDFENFSKKRRELIAKEVLGDVEVISNITHQGMFGENEARLGCYDTMDKSYPRGEALFPVALRWDVPVYIFKGKENLSEEVLSMAGIKEAAEKANLTDEIKNINILPHGGGYHINMDYTEIKVVESRMGNTFVLNGSTPPHGEMIITNPHELPYSYRGREVVEKIMTYDLGTSVAKLKPIMTLKI